jgi:hypothetical protein
MTAAPHPVIALVLVLALPAATSWIQVVTFALVIVVVVALYVARRREARPPSLDSQPLLPGEARWVVSRDGTVLDSCVHEAETGIATGWAVGHPISTWAPAGSPEAEHYRAAVEDRAPATFETSFVGPDGAAHVSRVALVPRSDGTVYCESWDVTDYVERCRESDRRAEVAERRVDELMRFASTDAIALFDSSRQTPDAVPTTVPCPSDP